MYSDRIVKLSIKELDQRMQAIFAPDADPDADDLFNVDSGVGAKVQFVAYLESLVISSTGTYTFIASQYDFDTGETYSVKVYAGYSSAPASALVVGDMYKIVGNIQEYPEKSKQYQISGLTYSNQKDGDGITFLNEARYYTTFDSTIAQDFTDNYMKNSYENITVTEVVSFTDGVLTFKGEAGRITERGKIDTTKTKFTFTVKADSMDSVKVGDVLKFGGLTVEKQDKTPSVIHITSFSNITWISHA